MGPHNRDCRAPRAEVGGSEPAWQLQLRTPEQDFGSGIQQCGEVPVDRLTPDDKPLHAPIIGAALPFLSLSARVSNSRVYPETRGARQRLQFKLRVPEVVRHRQLPPPPLQSIPPIQRQRAAESPSVPILPVHTYLTRLNIARKHLSSTREPIAVQTAQRHTHTHHNGRLSSNHTEPRA